MSKKTEVEDEIRTLHRAVQQYPDNQTLKNKLKYRLNKWYDLIKPDIYIIVANNEQYPWSSDDLGFETHDMFLKKDIKLNQVGDYQIFVDRCGNALKDSFSSLLVERKGCTFESDARGGLKMVGCDLYSTLMLRSNRERFYKEIERFESDPRFTWMVMICECTYEQFLRFTPKFNGKEYNHNNSGASITSRVASVNALEERGVSVRFVGSRERAVESYKSMVRLNVIGCYERFIKMR